MAISAEDRSKATVLPSAAHPLDPLSAQEITAALSILTSQQQLGRRVRFETVVLQEPEKDTVLNLPGWRPGSPERLCRSLGQRYPSNLRGGSLPG